MRTAISLVAVPVLMAAGAISAAEPGLPPYAKEACKFPAGYTIGAKTPPQFKKYTGVYVGKYDVGLLHTQVVTDISADGSAAMMVAVDNYPRWGVSRGCWALKGTFRNGVLSRTHQSGATLEYVYSSSGDTMRFTRRSSRNVTSGTLKKTASR